MKPKQSISRRLLVNVLSVYFLLTFAVTCIQLVAEYNNTKQYISDELKTLENTFSASLTRAIWELNTPQIYSIAEGLVTMPRIEGVLIRDENGEMISKMGNVDYNDALTGSITSDGKMVSGDHGLFGYSFPLVFEYSGRSSQVGDVTLFSSRQVVVERISTTIYFMIGSAFFKTTFLIVLFLISFRNHLVNPLGDLVTQVNNIKLDDLSTSRLMLKESQPSELSIIKNAFNDLLERVESAQFEVKTAQKQLIKSNDMLDQQNLLLEQEVAKKTANLSQAMMDLQKRKYDLEAHQNKLKLEIETRIKTEKELLAKTDELEDTIETLQQAHGKLIESEKFAALGGLVAGITHDVNTPIGVSVTATSVLQERVTSLQQKLSNQTLSAKDLERFIEDTQQGTELLTNNLRRASDLIASFKQIAVDQASEANRDINLNDYLNEIVTSLKPELKRGGHQVSIACPANLNLCLPAGALSQVFTNFIMNSIIHGFENTKDGTINISVEDRVDSVQVVYKDNGHGVTQEQQDKLFEPFYTTKRNKGGSGLGTSIAYNLVHQALGGEISISSQPEKGLSYTILIPKNRFEL
jgi:signal transduction histidine kinase